MARKIFIVTGGTSVQMPPDFNPNDNTIMAIGAGGTGGAALPTHYSGGAGAFSSINNAPWAPNQVIQIGIGQPIANPSTGYPNPVGGGDTWAGAATYAAALVGAKGAGPGGNTSGGTGGPASGGIGTTKYSGGNANLQAGGAAGPNGNGVAGTGSVAGSGDATHGGVGGTAGSPNGGAGSEFIATMKWDGIAWTAGTFPVGSGGGAFNNSGTPIGAGGLYGGGGAGTQADLGNAPGLGGQGALIISYTPISPGVMSDF